MGITMIIVVIIVIFFFIASKKLVEDHKRTIEWIDSRWPIQTKNVEIGLTEMYKCTKKGCNFETDSLGA